MHYSHVIISKFIESNIRQRQIHIEKKILTMRPFLSLNTVEFILIALNLSHMTNVQNAETIAYTINKKGLEQVIFRF